jgi:ATP-dependent DNA helicase RecQ
MLACGDDVVTLENFSYGDTPEPETVAALVGELLEQGDEFDVSMYDLAQRHDCRDLVVKTLLTYLELDGILRSTGQFYTEFKFQPRRPSEEILAQFDAARAEFIRGVFRTARKGRTWFTLDTEAACRKLGQPRERIIAALNYLEERGDLVVEATGTRQGYRQLRQPDDHKALVDSLAERFLDREAHDIARVESVVQLAEHCGCSTTFLLNYFGEERNDCGHCGRCEGGAKSATKLPRASSSPQIDAQLVRRLRAEKLSALRTPRQLARFLCGITSPAATRAKLRQRPEFGQFSHVPFAEVLKQAEHP